MYITKEMQNCTDYNDFFAQLKQAFQDAGWTLENDKFDGTLATTQDFVVSTNGESGTGPLQYFRAYYYNLTSIKFAASAYYDQPTDTHKLKTYSNIYKSGIIPSSGPFYAWFYGDKDFFFFITKNGTNYYDMEIDVGFTPFYGESVPLPNAGVKDLNAHTTTFIVNAGDEDLFNVGTWQDILDPENDLRLCKKILSIDSAAHSIMFDGEFDAAAGSRMGFQPFPILIGSTFGFYPVNEFGSSTVSSTAWPLVSSVAYSIGTNYMKKMRFLAEPFGLCERYVAGRFADPEANKLISDFPYGILSPNVLSAPDDAALNHEDVFGIGQKDAGTATGGASLSLTDTAKTWGVNEHAGRFCVITQGTGAGQVKKITSNTADTLTLSKDWNVTPDGTSEYVIVTSAYRYFKMSNELAVKIGG